MKASHNESRPCNNSYDNSPLTDFREQPKDSFHEENGSEVYMNFWI